MYNCSSTIIRGTVYPPYTPKSIREIEVKN